MTGADRLEPERSWPARLALSLCLLATFAGLIGLGVWQLERRTWKLDLIARVDRRIHAPPVAAPGPTAWPVITAKRDEYLHVQASGRFLDHAETYVQAVTALGPGYWALTPFRTNRGLTVLVNRGFVPPDRREPGGGALGLTGGQTTVTGLLRLSEPGGGFLRSNDPAHDRWYSRDVTAIAAARGLSDVAPYFIDADAAAIKGTWPRGGLTVVAFPNNHLMYAFTWFGLALLPAVAIFLAWSDRWRKRQMT